MSLANNHRFQLMKRIKDDLRRAAPEYFQSDDQLSSGDPGLILSLTSGGVAAAYIAFTRKTFNGFQVVAELSASAAEGLPEHDMWLAVDSDLIDQIKMAKLAAMCSRIGCSSLKIVVDTGTPAAASIAEANVDVSIPNDARLGAVGA